MDFAIVCPQRGGSHLLATALNSHPDIQCNYDYKFLAKEKLTGKVQGRIIRYNALSEILRTRPKKIIHLSRKLSDVVRSLVAHRWNYQNSGRSLHRLRGESVPVIGCPPLSSLYAEFYLKTIEQTFVELNVEAERAIGKRPCLKVSYRELTGGGDVEILPPTVSKKILEFLEVQVVPLKARTRKTGPY